MRTTRRAASFEIAEQQRQALIDLAVEVRDIAAALEAPAAVGATESIIERVRSEAFVVLVAGLFRIGKTTCINALLGTKLLPSTAVPTTAVVTAVRWGEERRAILYPRAKDQPPEDVPVEELARRIVIDNSNPDADNPYEWAEVRWPLDLCRKGVMLVDCPGRNEHEKRDAITVNWLRKADSVLFVQDALSSMSMTEAQFLRAYLDTHDPFFVINKINYIDPEERDDVEQNVRQRVRAVRGDRPEDKDRFFFVDAKRGLAARANGDDASWEASGMAALERALEDYLATERHKVKTIVPARDLRIQCGALLRSIAQQRMLLDKDLDELGRAYEAAQQPLWRLQDEGRHIAQELHNELRELGHVVERQILNRLTAMSEEIPAWAEDTVPESRLRTVPWKLKGQAEQVAEEITRAVADRLNEEFAEWVNGTLSPEIAARLNQISAALEDKAANFESSLAGVRFDLAGFAPVGGGSRDGDRMDAFVPGGLTLLGSAGQLLGSGLGLKDAMRSIVPGIAISVAVLVTPLGWPVAVAGIVGRAIFKSPGVLDKLQHKMKSIVGQEIADDLRRRAPTAAAEAERSLLDELGTVRQSVERAFSAQIESLRQEVTSVLESKRRGEQAVAQRRRQLDLSRDGLEDITTVRLPYLIEQVAGL